MKVQAFFDGGIRPFPNGGYARCYGWVIKSKDKIIKTGRGIEVQTDDVGSCAVEFEALVRAMNDLALCVNSTAEIEIFGDSRAVIDLCTDRGIPHTNSVTHDLQRVRCLSQHFLNLRFSWLPRELNAEADKLGRDAFAELSRKEDRVHLMNKINQRTRRLFGQFYDHSVMAAWCTSITGKQKLSSMSIGELGKKSEALRYAEESRGLNNPSYAIAQTCEQILLSSGMNDEAYSRYAIEANQSTTNLATFRAIRKKYPHKQASDILFDLVASTPGSEGKWFAAAKDATLYDDAIKLVNISYTDPRTLVRAANDFAITQPTFAVAAGMAALRWIGEGYGYEITSTDALDAYQAVLKTANAAGININQIKGQIKYTIESSFKNQPLLKELLLRKLEG